MRVSFNGHPPVQPRFASKYFLDTEFDRDSKWENVKIISVALVSEEGREFYEISSEFDENRVNPWVKEHVIPRLGNQRRIPLQEIKAKLKAFVGNDPDPEFYAKNGAQDWVNMCRIFGGMFKLPQNWPRYFNEIRQEWARMGKPKLPPHPGNAHNALADAKWDKIAWEYLELIRKTHAHKCEC